MQLVAHRSVPSLLRIAASNSGHQRLWFFEFSLRRELIPSLQLLNLFVRVERSQSIQLFFRGFLVLDVEPSPPMLNRIGHNKLDVLHLRAHRYDVTTNIMDFFLGGNT
jgi:hypothetical protein